MTAGVSVLWPTLFPHRSKQMNNAAISAWSHLYMVDEKVCLVFSFSALCHMRSNPLPIEKQYLRGGRQIIHFLEMKSARMIRESLQKPSPHITDALIMCALCMANHSSTDIGFVSQRESPFQSSFRRLQWLEVYGAKAIKNDYHLGLLQLVQLKGGLKEIRMPGLAAIISL